MAIVGFTVYEYSQRGQKKSWRLPFWESIGVVDIIVFPILLIVCMPFVFNQYSTVKKGRKIVTEWKQSILADSY
jgi:hypothetical protein